MPGIFICYRRDDTGGYAGRLYDRLVLRFGKDRIFMDIDAIPIGYDFVQVVDQHIQASNVMIALIGKNWLTMTDPSGRRRIDDPADFVRLEIEAALTGNITLIPVLVGGAEMPAPRNLPGKVVRLAYLNAFEIYDRMFEESVTSLVSRLSPFVEAPRWRRWRIIEPALRDWVRALRRFWASHGRTRRIGFPLAAIALPVVLLSFLAARLMNWSPLTHSGVPAVASRKPVSQAAGGSSVPRLGAGATEAPAAELKSPSRVSELPPVVEAARYVSDVLGGFDRAVGPHQPKVLWKADFPSLGIFLGLADDGTLYFGDGLIDTQLESIYAIRDGKQTWGYKMAGGNDLTRALFAADGRVWVEQHRDFGERSNDQRFFVYNSRGEGGLTTVKEYPALSQHPNVRDYGWGKGGISGWTARQKLFDYKNCEFGELTGIYTDSQGREMPWKLNVDGSCRASEVNQDGDLITVNDTGTLYSVSAQGRLRWTRKVACQPDRLVALGSTGTLYACGNILHALRGSEPRWELKLQQEPDYSSIKVDKSNTLYLLTKAPVSFLAIDDEGKLLWQLPFDSAMPLGLDKAGRMYIRSQSTLMCLSD